MPRLTILEKKQAKEKAKRSLSKELPVTVRRSSMNNKPLLRTIKQEQVIRAKVNILKYLDVDPIVLYRSAEIQDIISMVQDISQLKLSKECNGPVLDQLYRSLNSVAANLVEGWARPANGMQTNFYFFARGSAYESLVHNQCLNLPFESRILKAIEFVNSLIRSQVSNLIDDLNNVNESYLLDSQDPD